MKSIYFRVPKELVVPRGEHSPLGPSASKRWMHCPGSVNASLNAPDSESKFAAEGTAAHYLSELCRKEGRMASDYLTTIIKTGGYEFEVDEEMADSAQEFIDWCDEQPGFSLIEQRIDYSEYMPEDIVEAYGPTFGTLDDARLNDGTVTITDFKHGKGVQEFAKHNTQLMLQALGVYIAYSYLYRIKDFVLQISQPRLGHKDRWEISVLDLLKWARDELPGFAERVGLGLEFAAGDWCQFCRIRSRCKVRANSAIQLMLDEGEFDNLDAMNPTTLKENIALAAANAPLLKPEAITKILPLLKFFTDWAADVKKGAIRGLIAGERFGDWKLVAGRSKRQVINTDRWVSKLQSLEVDPYVPAKPIGVAVAEKALGKKEFARRFKIDEDFVKPQGKPTLAPGSDKRDPINTSCINEFDNLDEDDEWD